MRRLTVFTRSRGIWILVGALSLVLSFVWMAGFLERAEPTPLLDSLVMVPLVNVSGDPEQEYLAQGIGEAVSSRLTELQGLRLVSHRRARQLSGTETSQELAADLGVDAVLRGSVRTAGPWVRVEVELIESATGLVLLAKDFNHDLEDVRDLETEVAAAVAEVVRERLQPSRAIAGRVDPDAYRAYLRGRFYRHRGEPNDLERAVGYLEQAVDLDPAFAEAHAALAEVWLLRAESDGKVLQTAWENSSARAAEALRLNPALPAAHAADAMVKFFLDWDFAAAGLGFEKALEITPNEATSVEHYARFLTISGRFDEAIDHYGILNEMEPDGEARTEIVQVLLFAHRYDEARDRLQELMIERPDTADVHLLLGLLYEQLGRESESVAAYIRAMDRYDLPNWQIEAMTALSDKEGFAGLFSVLAENARGPVQKAAWHARLGEHRRAIELLEEGLQHRDTNLPWIAVHPAFDGLSDEPRYRRLLDVLGLEKPRLGGDPSAFDHPAYVSYR